MSAALVTLDKEDLAKRIRESTTYLSHQRNKLEPVETLKTFFAENDRSVEGGWCERASFLTSSINLARLEHANGAPPTRVREVLQEGVTAYEPVVACFDYTPFFSQFAVHVSQAEKYDGKEMSHDLGQVFLAPSKNLGPQYKTVRVKVRKQPAQLTMEKALKAALVAWDFERAKAMAKAYQLLPPVKGATPNRLGILREAILGNDKSAIVFLENFTRRGYEKDFPPERLELPEGVIRGDAALVRAGLKAVSTRFKTVWTANSYRTPAKLRRFGSWEKMAPAIHQHLIGMRWTMSDWVVAWMALAWHRGMKEAFSQPELFCEWASWELCCPEPSPAPSKPAVGPPRLSSRATELRKKLFAVASAGDAEAIKEMVAQGVKLDAYNQDRVTALMLAAKGNHVPAVVVLLEAGADVTKLDPKGKSILGIAAEEGRREIITAVLSSGVHPDLTDKPVTPLVRASRRGDLDIMRVLLDAGADPNRISTYGNSSALVDAAQAGHFDAVRLLIAAGADVDKALSESDGFCPLHFAAQRGNLDFLRLLLGAGANVNIMAGNWGWTPLHAAAAGGHHGIIQSLIAAGASLNAQTTDGSPSGETPLMAAVYPPGHPECVRVLLEAGADPSIRNKRKQTVLDRAQGLPDCLKILKQHARRG